MLPDDIAEFDKLVPQFSPLGREFHLLKENLAMHKSAFELATDKMDYDTSAYRRGNMMIEKFLSVWLPKCRLAFAVADETAREWLDVLEGRITASDRKKHAIHIDRRSEARIWQHFALESYRERLPRKIRRLKRYHPGLVSSLFKSWRMFRREIQEWKYQRVPFDGSRAMHAMYGFIVRVSDLAVSHD